MPFKLRNSAFNLMGKSEIKLVSQAIIIFPENGMELLFCVYLDLILLNKIDLIWKSRNNNDAICTLAVQTTSPF